ncbi:MAG: hypothetical protein COV91_00185 [Candidatus Taylorbacteria bacterium CG11_big_fil_rev_8_21_14_0_20_46_11]|uniref:Probable DNA 3'-5' helicase RecG n=1 Tax=Candidatus Taylorbacteria bacterium CG11_big_fil_rev_8_21_14_0_20_46_11 TaxID=1975025 RepID=A0A2H0KD40_9BACT|nr:MAG: hypothetical protein COV91_00185 [Candidatus Taylorbacteria bacterium CG11_big_fil_rev_8_21_14_0_20_46_11]
MNLLSPLTDIFRLVEPQQKALRKLRIKTAEDLLYHFPTRYGDVAEMRTIDSLRKGDSVVVFGRISKLKASKGFRTKIPMGTAELADDTGKIQIVWFNQPYLAKMIPEEALVRVEGKVSQRRAKPSDATRSTLHASRSLYFSNPKIERVNIVPQGVGESLFGEAGETHHLHPVYPESRGVTTNWLFHHIQKIIASGILDSVVDPIPPEILEKYHLPTLKTALIWMHTPQQKDHAVAARKRFAFEEVFFIQLEKQKERHLWKKEQSFVIDKTEEHITEFTKRFPYELTGAQKHAITAITGDFRRGDPMARLLEGDVGSGKTAVAATTAYAVVTSRPKDQNFGNLQVAYMCPTEILARQQFENFISFFSHLPINIGLITSAGCQKFPSKVSANFKTGNGATNISRAQLLKWVANGEIPILVGTHSLIQKSVKFKHLAYAIIDEQHRFGINQRKALVRRTNAEQTQKNAEKPQMDTSLLYKDLTYRIRQALFTVKKNLGGGHKEIVYQRALAEELTACKLSFKREVQIPILYRGKHVGIYQPDFVVEDAVILELKALNFVGSVEQKQIWTYLKGSSYRLALLVNFGPKELTINRIVYDTARNSSASGQHSSASVPHLLSMTATPIPRTLALTIYGDLDLTVLDELPPGRKPIITEPVVPKDRDATYEKIRKELKAGRQMYVITPRIDEPDPDKEFAVQAKSAKAEAVRLKEKVFPEYVIGVMHSKLKDDEKEETMEAFKDGKIHILVSTSVVEVGVNVPNATVIIIEGAERFGLAQLHQLRGRVLRSSHQAFCYVFTESAGAKTADRLKALRTAKNGFELAKYDLKFRGAGELSGSQQWGVSDVAMEALQNLKMVEAARAEAKRLLEEDESLSRYPLLQSHLASRKKEEIHFE